MILFVTQGLIVGIGACINEGSSSPVFSSLNRFISRSTFRSSIRSAVRCALLSSHLLDVAL